MIPELRVEKTLTILKSKIFVPDNMLNFQIYALQLSHSATYLYVKNGLELVKKVGGKGTNGRQYVHNRGRRPTTESNLTHRNDF